MLSSGNGRVSQGNRRCTQGQCSGHQVRACRVKGLSPTWAARAAGASNARLLFQGREAVAALSGGVCDVSVRDAMADANGHGGKQEAVL